MILIQIGQLPGHGYIYLRILKLLHKLRAQLFLNCMISFQLSPGCSKCCLDHFPCGSLQIDQIPELFNHFLRDKGFLHFLPVGFLPEPVCLDDSQLIKQLFHFFIFIFWKLLRVQRHFGIFTINLPELFMPLFYKHSAAHCTAVSGYDPVFTIHILNQNILHYTKQKN